MAAFKMTFLWTLGVSVVAFVLAFGLWILKLGFTEDVYFQRDSLEYYVLISSRDIAEAPVVNPVGKPTYHSSCGDGPKAPSQSIFYESGEDPEKLKSVMSQYLVECGFRPREEGSVYGGDAFVRGDDQAELGISSTSAGTIALSLTVIDRSGF